MARLSPKDYVKIGTPELEFTGVIGSSWTDSTPSYPHPRRPPQGAPNVLVVLLDDVGFGQPSTFGGPIDMPVLDRLAGGGLRYNRFHTAGMCSPTRAALLTGRNHHVTGNGAVSEMGTGYPGYSTMWPRSAASVAEILRLHGYSTASFGKWHNTPDWETGPFGPFDRWPTNQGFEYFYGFMGADNNQWNPGLVENTQYVEPHSTPEQGYHLDIDLADHAIRWIEQQQSATADRPFFAYYAPGSAHAPHHAPKEWIDRYRGRFAHGWDRQRELTFARQMELGVIPAGTVLTPRPAEIPAWDSLSVAHQAFGERLMEAFAGALSHCDHQIGRVIDAIDALGQLDNTLVLYVAGDNGPAGEGTLNGQFNKWAVVNSVTEDIEEVAARLDEIGSPSSYNNYPVGWAWSGSTPLQWLKQIASHLGASRNGLVVHWPRRVPARREPAGQFHHVIDLAPTILEAAGIPIPDEVNGIEQSPIQGCSMAYSFDDPRAESPRTTQYFEIIGNRSIYHQGLMASARHARLPWMYTGQSTGEFDDDPWELYDLGNDFSQARDLAAAEPGKLQRMRERWIREATLNQVFPLDDRVGDRIDPTNRPGATSRRHFRFTAAGLRLTESSSPNLKGRSHRIVADVTVGEAAGGILVKAGGRFAGYALYLQDGRPRYVHNWVAREIYLVEGGRAVPAGRHTVTLEFTTDEEKLGSGGLARLLIDDAEVGRGHLAHTVPYRFSYTETFDIGRASGTAVHEGYAGPFPFEGKIHSISVEVLDALPADQRDLAARMEMEIQRATE